MMYLGYRLPERYRMPQRKRPFVIFALVALTAQALIMLWS